MYYGSGYEIGKKIGVDVNKLFSARSQARKDLGLDKCKESWPRGPGFQ